MIEHHNFSVMFFFDLSYFIELTTANKGAGVGTRSRSKHKCDGISASRQHQFLELAWVFALALAVEFQVNQYGSLTRLGTLKNMVG